MPVRLMPGQRTGLLALFLALLGSVFFIGSSPAQKPARKLTSPEMATHVLNRLAFGPRPGQVQEVVKMGWKKWVEEQLYPDKIEHDLLDKTVKQRCPSLSMSINELQEFAKQAKKNQKGDKAKIKDELRDAVLFRAVFSRRQFLEVITEFWRNHFNVWVDKVPFLATHYEENIIRKYSFGKFDDFLMAVAKHPAMLVYLDNYVSTRRGLNENYARELMELHTLGVDNFYTQKDVVNLAKVLTGWTCGWKNGNYISYFNPAMHDSTPVTVVGCKVNGIRGEKDGEKVIRHLANHPGTATFICTKLCRYLVNDFPSTELVDNVSKVYLKTGGDLREVYRAIIFSPEFADYPNYRAKFKTPFEYTASVLRITRSAIDSPQQLFKELKLMGQPIYDYEEPTGYSDQREAWLDPGIMVYRWNFAIALVTGKLNGVKLGSGFVEEVMRAAPASRPRKVMSICLPGIVDNKALWLASHTTDPRAMVAWALGSPSFQQQ